MQVMCILKLIVYQVLVFSWILGLSQVDLLLLGILFLGLVEFIYQIGFQLNLKSFCYVIQGDFGLVGFVGGQGFGGVFVSRNIIQFCIVFEK